MDKRMSEPISGAAAGAAGWKVIGGAAGAIGIGAALASAVVMMMSLPKTGREWAVALIATLISSIGGGAYTIIKLGILKRSFGGHGRPDAVLHALPGALPCVRLRPAWLGNRPLDIQLHQQEPGCDDCGCRQGREGFDMSPNQKAFLDMIAFSEIGHQQAGDKMQRLRRDRDRHRQEA
jgi:hypothetical protein